MGFFRIRLAFSFFLVFLSILFCQSAMANKSFVSDASDKILGDSYFFNQQCVDSDDSIFCLKDYFYGKSEWYPVGIITIGQKPVMVGKLVNGMEFSSGVVLDDYSFNKLIYEKRAVDIALVSADGREFGVFNLSYLMSRVGMCKSLGSLGDRELFHYEDYGCDVSGSDYSFFGIHVRKKNENGLINSEEKVLNEEIYKKGFYLLSNSGGKITGYRMPNGFSDNGRFYIMIK